MMIFNDCENSMIDCVEHIASFDIFNDGNKQTISKEDKKFNDILNKIEELFKESRLMPAFGVSLHNEMQHALTQNKWLQINFVETQSKNGLCFNSLLFKLEEVQGFNLIRLYENKYEGRCLYLDLDAMTDLKKLII